MPEEKLTPAQEEAKRRYPTIESMSETDITFQTWKQFDFLQGTEWQKSQDAAYIKQLEEALFWLTGWAHRAWTDLTRGGDGAPGAFHPITKADDAIKRYKGEE